MSWQWDIPDKSTKSVKIYFFVSCQTRNVEEALIALAKHTFPGYASEQVILQTLDPWPSDPEKAASDRVRRDGGFPSGRHYAEINGGGLEGDPGSHPLAGMNYLGIAVSE